MYNSFPVFDMPEIIVRHMATLYIKVKTFKYCTEKKIRTDEDTAVTTMELTVQRMHIVLLQLTNARTSVFKLVSTMVLDKHGRIDRNRL